jgi:hypothetical protein
MTFGAGVGTGTAGVFTPPGGMSSLKAPEEPSSVGITVELSGEESVASKSLKSAF